MKTYASLRFMGDYLDPAVLTDILQVNPTMAYRKGEIYKREHGHHARGRTGLWLLSSKNYVHSSDLNEHLAYLVNVLSPLGSLERLSRLRALMRDGHIQADVGCFWHSAAGKLAPAIRNDLLKHFEEISAPVELEMV